MGIFRKRKPEILPAKSEASVPQVELVVRSDHQIEARASKKTSSKRLAQFDVSVDREHPRIVSIYDYDLRSFGVEADELPHLIDMHMDVLSGFESDERFCGWKEHFNWLIQTHPHTARLLNQESYRRFAELVHHVSYR